jgi:carbamoyltransferase
MLTLGINAAYHDSAACLVIDGDLVAAAEEERFTHIKHAKRPLPFSAWELPYHAIDYCLAEAGARLADVDHVAYSYEPHLLQSRLPEAVTLPLEPPATAAPTASPWDPLFLSYIVNAPRQLAGGAPHHLSARLAGHGKPPYQWHYVQHHLAHQASAFLAAPFDDAAVLTLDGRGETASTQYGLFRDGAYRRLGEVRLPHSLGLFYENITRHLGFLHSSDEYKVMALASFGSDRLLNAMRGCVHSEGNGQYRILPMPLTEWCAPRERAAPFLPQHADLAHAAQVVLEEVAIDIASWLREVTGSRNLAMAGGVALNCVMNSRIRDAGLFDSIFVQPAAGDAGTALGAALWIDRTQRGERGTHHFAMEHVYYGPGFADADIEATLRRAKVDYARPQHYPSAVAAELASDRVVGWFQGRMEFGPRALGSRSILASPLHAQMQNRLNEIKDREDFRPVAPAVLEESAPDWFSGCEKSPFMLFVYDVREHQRERIPAACHSDGTARVQTVARSNNPLYYDTIEAFGRRTGVPLVINTSFNTRGKPIVCTPRDALECFYTSPIDILAMGPFLVRKGST